MDVTNTRGATHNYGAPAYWKPDEDGECAVLEVRVDHYGKRRFPMCVSTWKPTPEEIVHLVHGGVIELSVVGDQPPVMLTVVDPIKPPAPVRADAPSVVINEHGHGFDEHGPAYPL